MKTELSAYFTLTNFEVEPEVITNSLNVSPSKTWKKGDLVRPNTNSREKENGWQLKSNPDSSEELENHIQFIIESLRPNWDKLVKLASSCHIELSCVIYIEDEVPSIHFDRKLIEQLAELKAEIDIDLYDFTEE